MDNVIHETAIIEDGVDIGVGNFIGANCLIKNGTKIGNNNRFEAFVSVGTAPEHRDFFNKEGKGVEIGDSCVFREFTTINSGAFTKTKIGNNVVMLRGSHIGHDSQISDFCNLSCNVLIGGHSHLMEGCNFGLGAICHQYSKIGAYSLVGMGSVVTKKSKVSPGDIFVGSPVKFLKKNTIGLERASVTSEELARFYTDWLNKA